MSTGIPSALLELEYIRWKERMAKTRLNNYGIPQIKKLEDFDLSWPKGGLTERKFKELSSLLSESGRECHSHETERPQKNTLAIGLGLQGMYGKR